MVWILSISGSEWRSAQKAAQRLGSPKYFRPAQIIEPSFTIMNEGLPAQQAWRSTHWGMLREPIKIRWLRDRSGNYVLIGEGGIGLPHPLAKQLSIDHAGVTVELAGRDPYWGTCGSAWSAGKQTDLPPSRLAAMLEMAGLGIALPF